MRNENAEQHRGIITFLLALPLLILSCTNLGMPTSSTTRTGGRLLPASSSTKGGAKLWTQKCSMCHNLRAASSLSAEKWDIVMMHMRIRANLTALEHTAILDHLKALASR